MPWAGQRRFYGSKPPTVAKRRARAVLFLVNCPSIEEVTVDTLVRRFDLKPAVAQELLARVRHG